MENPPAPAEERPAPPAWGLRHLWSALGILLLLLWFPFYAFVSLIAPEWTAYPAVAIWVVLFGLAVWWFRQHPVRTFFVGAGAIVLWHAAGLLFGAVLGWTA